MTSVFAHGLIGRADLPLPGWMFLWGAAAVLAVSFIGLAVLWREPLMQQPHGRALPARLGRTLTAPAVEVLCGLIGVGLYVVVLWSAFWGEWPSSSNFAQQWVFVIFWVGLVPVSALFGDVFNLFNPWRAIGRAAGRMMKRLAPGQDPLPYPAALGYWPAAVGLAAFGWLELAHSSSAQSVGIATVIYTFVQLVGMGLFGVDAWTRRGDAFAVYFGLMARLSPWQRDGRVIRLRRPLSGLPQWELAPRCVAILTISIGIVTFDGSTSGPVWQEGVSDTVLSFWNTLGLQLQPLELAFATGMFACILIVAGFYALGTLGAQRAAGGPGAADLRRRFAHTLAPIALAYAGAHYFSLLAYSGQSIWAVASDPLGRGWDLFGTAAYQTNFNWIDTNGIWWVQLTLILGGHVAGLALSHDRALAIYPDGTAAVRSQYWLLGVMVGFTTLALWLLHTAAYNP